LPTRNSLRDLRPDSVWRSEKVTAIFTNDDEEIDLSFLLRAGGGTERKAVSSKEEVREGRLDDLYGRPKTKKNPRLEILGYGYYFVHLVEDSKWTFMESSIFKKKKKINVHFYVHRV